MDILRITHSDFTLTFECNNLQRIWEKGCLKLGGAHCLTSTYTWSDDCVVERMDETERYIGELVCGATNSGAYFFEQTDYSVWVEFKEGTTQAAIDTSRNDVNERFSWKRDKRILMGFINYGNEIGRADLPVSYTRNGEQKHFVFSYDVLSAKLDYHHDWKIILRDIESEYRMLSLDYLRKTYHGISEGEGESFDLIWWNIFHSLQDTYIRACKNIIERPRHRLHAINTYKRADQIRRFLPLLEQQFAEHRTEEQRLYYLEDQQTSQNTLENRFLKYTLCIIEKRYRSLSNRILLNPAYRIADSEKKRIQQIRDELQHLLHNPFFRTIGKFEGLKQESLVLQRDVNYSQVFRTYIILRKSFNLNDGLYRMETKDIATLYEIWCFIQVEKVVKELFQKAHGEDIRVEHSCRPEMHGLFTRDLTWGEQSKIVFKQGDITLAELFYNPQHGENVNGVKGIHDLRSYTVPQRPDIVLQLTKDDVQRGMYMTYLFDAKYRVEIDGAGWERPPQDTINQMHRYRDAIYYSHSADGLKKEVLGGYILFPGNMSDSDIYRQSVDEVNIGAFPMLPGDEAHQMLRNFISDLMQKNATQIIEQVIPQKGTFVEVGNRVLMGLVKQSARKGYFEAFENGTAELYYTGPHFPTSVSLHNLHFFMPIIKGKGIRDVYEVTKVRTITSREAHQVLTDPDDMRLAFTLKFHHRHFDHFHKIDMQSTKLYSFIDTTFEELGNYLID